MSGKLAIIIIIALRVRGYSFAQMDMDQPPSDSQPSSLNITGQQYPRVDFQRRAIFRVNAPEAQSVVVSLGNTALTKGEDGYWTGTTTPLSPGFHYYHLIINGLAVADPATETFFGSGNLRSDIKVPAEDQDFYLPKNVPHEAFEKAGIKHVYYESPSPVHQLLTWRRDSRYSFLNKRSCIDSFNKII